METPGLLAAAVGLAVLAALEAVLFALRRFAPRFVLVSKQGGDGGSAVPLAHLARGAFFGEMSLLTGAPRSATVTAQGGVTVLVLSQPALAPLVEADPEIAETLSRAVTDRRADTEATLETRARSRDPRPAEADESSILDRIRAFFKLD